MISFVIEMKPTPKERPRFFRRGRFVGTYTPKKTTDASEEIKKIARNYISKPLMGPICLRIVHSTKTNDKKKLGNPKTTRPDLDNLDKLVMDALNGIAYVDDGQVVVKDSAKYWSSTDAIFISIWGYQNEATQK